MLTRQHARRPHATLRGDPWQVAVHAPPGEPQRGEGAPPELGRLTVLLIDDDWSLPDLVALLVKDALGPRAEVEHERSGAAGFRRAVVLKPDLILLDLRLPGLDGLTVLRLIKAEPAIASIPVIIVTAHADWMMLGMAIDAGAMTYLFKPLEGETFRRAVRKALGQ